ncbi:MAG: arginine deiminase family protein [Bacteroidota bacterium]
MPTAPPAPARPSDAVDTLHVTSETALLRQVVVHTPGEEMSLVAPDNKDALLFDDILFTDRAREEHQQLCAVFERVVGKPEAVLQIGALLRGTFEDADAGADARAWFVAELSRALPARNYARYETDLLALDPDALDRFAVTGQSPLPLVAPPLPNLLFTRDLCAVVGSHVVMSRAATDARRRESVIVEAILRHHPRFAANRDQLFVLPDYVSFEGGDLLVVNESLVLIGQSERTSLGGVMAVTERLLAETPVTDVLMVNLPNKRSCMHLDTVFTFIDDETCMVYPPIIARERHNVFHFSEYDATTAGGGRFQTRVLPSVQVAIEELTGHPFTFIPCGGADPLNQEREQWTDGANLFAVAPNLVLAYERNRHTFAALRDQGFHVVNAEHFLSFYENGTVPVGEKVALQLTGHELSRGRGGARCMTMPLVREG